MEQTPGPVVAETTVPAEPQDAFTAFTAQMGEWWDPLLTPDAGTWEGVAIDPDGDVEMVHSDGRHVWGRVLTWEPPGTYEQEFWLGHSPDAPTRLRVTFADADGGGTRVRLEHGGWTPATASARERYTHWSELLERFSAHLER